MASGIRVRDSKIRRSPYGSIKRRILQLLLELDESQEYQFAELVRYLIKNDISLNTAAHYIKFLPETGALQKTERGTYKVDKKLVRKMLEELTGSSP